MAIESPENHPTVLVFAGHDPSGGAGIVADIEAITSMGGHAAPVVTAIVPQDTTDVKGYTAISTALIIEQARAVLEDMPVQCIKIGMLGSRTNIEVIHSILLQYENIPVVLDPVLGSGAGTALSDDSMVRAMCDLLLPLTTVITPNSIEARKLARQSDDLDACAHELLAMGSQYVLVTGSHENTHDVLNTLYGGQRKLQEYKWPRLAHDFHGSGCTLASSIAGLLAQGREPMSAIHEAQKYTWNTLKHGYRAGMGQLLPDRFFWAKEKKEGSK